jgi:hypothetical protein
MDGTGLSALGALRKRKCCAAAELPVIERRRREVCDVHSLSHDVTLPDFQRAAMVGGDNLRRVCSWHMIYFKQIF